MLKQKWGLDDGPSFVVARPRFLGVRDRGYFNLNAVVENRGGGVALYVTEPCTDFIQSHTLPPLFSGSYA